MLLEYFPIIKPNKVNKKLHKQKIEQATKYLLVISLMPRPIVNESMLTLKAKKIMLMRDKLIIISSFLKN